MSSSTPVSVPLLIRRAHILMPDGEFLTGDVLMAGGKIDRIEPEIAIASDGEVKEIDAAGLTLLPGVRHGVREFQIGVGNISFFFNPEP